VAKRHLALPPFNQLGCWVRPCVEGEALRREARYELGLQLWCCPVGPPPLLELGMVTAEEAALRCLRTRFWVDVGLLPVDGQVIHREQRSNYRQEL
jgi:hypothetical protein